jgi:hypothetical protein
LDEAGKKTVVLVVGKKEVKECKGTALKIKGLVRL